jgi:hypothetical protein
VFERAEVGVVSFDDALAAAVRTQRGILEALGLTAAAVA